MRVIVFFDLPVITANERREYRTFRKYLIKSGFLMVQESVYCKLVPNSNAGDMLVEKVRKNRPSGGIVQLLRVTEKQYSKMEYITGEKTSNVLDSDERLVFI